MKENKKNKENENLIFVPLLLGTLLLLFGFFIDSICINCTSTGFMKSGGLFLVMVGVLCIFGRKFYC